MVHNWPVLFKIKQLGKGKIFFRLTRGPNELGAPWTLTTLLLRRCSSVLALFVKYLGRLIA